MRDKRETANLQGKRDGDLYDSAYFVPKAILPRFGHIALVHSVRTTAAKLSLLGVFNIANDATAQKNTDTALTSHRRKQNWPERRGSRV